MHLFVRCKKLLARAIEELGQSSNIEIAKETAKLRCWIAGLASGGDMGFGDIEADCADELDDFLLEGISIGFCGGNDDGFGSGAVGGDCCVGLSLEFGDPFRTPLVRALQA